MSVRKMVLIIEMRLGKTPKKGKIKFPIFCEKLQDHKSDKRPNLISLAHLSNLVGNGRGMRVTCKQRIIK